MQAYLDNSATTKCAPEVVDVCVKVMSEDYGNPSSNASLRSLMSTIPFLSTLRYVTLKPFSLRKLKGSFTDECSTDDTIT